MTNIRYTPQRSTSGRPAAPTLARDTHETLLIRPDEYARRHCLSIETKHQKAGKIALVIAAYNEADVIGYTIQSAITAGLSPRDIYVVDDNSDDATSDIARRIIGHSNVLRVQRSGKGLAISQITANLCLTKRYRWIHIADADGAFDERYFTVLRRDLRVENAAATGYVTSLKGGYISQYRLFEYTIGMDIVRRFQSIAGVISIVPGPTSVFRNDVFDKLNFNDNALCEDFDVTLQIHRNRLGGIQFIPEAIAKTQDPLTFRDFIKQITRWNRGVLQQFVKHGIGHRLTKIDAYLSYQIMQNMLFFGMYFLWFPFITYLTGNQAYLAVAFLADVVTMFGFVGFAAARSGQHSIMKAFPVIYFLRWVNMYIFLKSFVEVIIMRRYVQTKGSWETVARRAQVELTV